MKGFLKNKGTQLRYRSEDNSRESFKQGLIEEGDLWMEMIKSRNLTSHTYSQEKTEEIGWQSAVNVA
ncbi:nucleotidyltransferase substrate binding protein [Chlorobium sp.]|uniref:nucleotidyltransferase substrate binding protein n=1 Tax=Chlorobium sp. TaxID=1095 RepID=UPI0025BCAA0A|nr:nucleotidyltransferase substrate binding protein [Chlorobium sp.]